MAPKFVGFYLSLREKRDAVNVFLWQFIAQLLKGIKFYQKHQVQIHGKPTVLTEDLLADKVADASDALNLKLLDNLDDFVLFRGAYIDAFQDGTLLFKILKYIVETLGDTAAPLEAKLSRYKSEGRSRAELRAAYWYIDANFVSHLPSDYQVAFTVDCILYGEWQVGHPNLIGLHLLALTWMLGVKQFWEFAPLEMQACPQLISPVFQHFLPQTRIRIPFGEEKRPPEEGQRV